MISYDFYGYLVVRLLAKHRGYRKYMDNEYARISQDVPTDDKTPIIDIEIPSKLPEAQDGDIVKTIRYKNLFTYKFLVRGIDTAHVTIYFKQHWIDRVYMNAIGVFLQAQVLEPIMYLKLLERDILFMHAGGVTRDGMGILLPAYGGTGKTTLSMALLNQGAQLLGDDLLLVDIEKGIVHPYPRPLHIFTYNVRNLRGATIPFKYRFAVYAKNVIRIPMEFFLRTELLISTRIHADELFTNREIFGKSSPYGAIAFLRKEGPAVEVVKVTKANVDGIATGIAESADLNDSLEVLFEGEPERWSHAQTIEHATIVALLKSRGLIAYVNTRAMDLDHLENFTDQILGRESV